MNKKGFLPLLPLAVLIILAVGLVAWIWGTTIGLFSFLSSTKGMFFIAGMTILVLSLIYGFKTDWNKNKAKMTITFVIIGALMVIVSGSGLMQAEFSPGNVLSVNTYGKISCDIEQANVPLLSTVISSKESSARVITCGIGMDAYTDTCTFTITGKDITILECQGTSNCRTVTTLRNGPITKTIDLDVDRNGIINTGDSLAYNTLKISTVNQLFVLENKINVEVRGNKYVLRDDQSTGMRTQYEQGCDLRKIALGSNEHIVDDLGYTQIPFGKYVNYIDGAIIRATDNIITQGDIRYYIEQPGYKIPIKKAEDGTYYAYNKESIADSKIECLPSNIMLCNADATFRKDASTDVSGQPCSTLKGIPIGTFTLTSTGKCCMWKCENNVATAYNCEECKVCESGFALDSKTNECVEISDSGKIFNQTEGKCSWYQESYTKTEKDYGYLYWRALFGNPLTTETQDCRNAGWFNAAIIAIIVLVLGTVLIFVWAPNKPRRRK